MVNFLTKEVYTEVKALIFEAKTREGRLSDWERKFMEDIEAIIVSNTTDCLSDKQWDKLMEISEKVYASG